MLVLIYTSHKSVVGQDVGAGLQQLLRGEGRAGSSRSHSSWRAPQVASPPFLGLARPSTRASNLQCGRAASLPGWINRSPGFRVVDATDEDT